MNSASKTMVENLRQFANEELPMPWTFSRQVAIQNALSEASNEIERLEARQDAWFKAEAQHYAEKALEIERLRDFLTTWIYDGSLQSFEDRERFRSKARALLAGVSAEKECSPERPFAWFSPTDHLFATGDWPPPEPEVAAWQPLYLSPEGRPVSHGKDELHQRDEVMNPPASAARGAEARNLNTSQRHGTGAVPQGDEEQAARRHAAPCQCGHSALSHHIGCTEIKGPCIVCSCMEWRARSAQETEGSANG